MPFGAGEESSSNQWAQTVRSKKIAALVAVIALVVMFSFAGQSETAYAQNADSGAVVSTVSLDLATTAIDTDGVDTVHPPGSAALVAFPNTWATIESTRNSVYANTDVNHPPEITTAVAIPSAWTNTFPRNSVSTDVTSADLMRDSRYVIVVNNGETLLGNPGPDSTWAKATNNTDIVGVHIRPTGFMWPVSSSVDNIVTNTAATDTTNSSVLGTAIDITVVTVATIVTIAMFATLFVLTVVIGYLVVTGMYDRSSRASSAATRRLATTNDNNWLTTFLATLVTMIRPITNAATRAGQAITTALRQLDVKRSAT